MYKFVMGEANRLCCLIHSMEAIVDWSWEEAVFMSQLLGNCSLPNDDSFWEPNPNNADYSMPTGSDFSGGLFPFSSHENYNSTLTNNVMDYSRGSIVGKKRSRPTSTCEIGSSKKSMKYEEDKSSCASKAKARASRGSATDPQSLYARKRRERINERLRILQTLVPNGTKVDISTMLEEAVQYVKFLQLQIKVLSSDDMWMYAPIAYNGMDIGLDFRSQSS